MNASRFEHFYIVIGDTIKFDADEQELLTAVGVPDRTPQALAELSYRNPLAFAVLNGYEAYHCLLGYGACDSDGFVDLIELERIAGERATRILNTRSDLLLQLTD
jgi:hypothetical protein